MCLHKSFFFKDTPTTEIYTLSLHDALPISIGRRDAQRLDQVSLTSCGRSAAQSCRVTPPDRKSTRLNSSHTVISYAVFCLKKKNIIIHKPIHNVIMTRTYIFFVPEMEQLNT